MFRICAKQDIVSISRITRNPTIYCQEGLFGFLGAGCNCGFGSHPLNEVEFKLMSGCLPLQIPTHLGIASWITRPTHLSDVRVCMHTCL